MKQCPIVGKVADPNYPLNCSELILLNTFIEEENTSSGRGKELYEKWEEWYYTVPDVFTIEENVEEYLSLKQCSATNPDSEFPFNCEELILLKFSFELESDAADLPGLSDLLKTVTDKWEDWYKSSPV